MDVNELKSLAFACADKAANQKLAELTISSGEFSITVKTHMSVYQNDFTGGQVVVSQPSVALKTAEEAPSEKLPGTVVNAPLVGTFYASNSPDEPPLVAVGQHVEKGDTLFIIEAMKTMNSIVSPCGGIISRILAQNGDMVEYKQPIVVIE